MRKCKKLCAIILALVMAVTVLPCSRLTTEAAAKTPKIAANASVLMHGTKALNIQKNGYTITKIVSVKSSKNAVARAVASKKAVTVYGIKNGKAKITVKVKAKKGKKTKDYSLNTTATVKDPAFKLSKKSIQVGKEAKITKSNLIKKATVSYTASGSCVSVTKAGKITGKSAGSSVIKAKVSFPKTKYAKKKSVTYTVGTIKVTKAPGPAPQPQDLYMLRSTYVTWVGGAVGVSPVNMGTEPVDFSQITYTSSDPRVAKLSAKNNNGCVIGVKKRHRHHHHEDEGSDPHGPGCCSRKA